MTRTPVTYDQNGWQTSPSNEPRIAEIRTTLEDGKVSKVTQRDPITGQVWIDEYNNVQKTWEYDFGMGALGPLIRSAHTTYLTTNGNQGNVNYATDANIHIRNLPIQKIVYDAAGSVRSQTDFIYDYYGAFSLVDCPGIVQHDGAFQAGYGARGNLTEVVLRNPGGSPSEIHLHNQYDIAGNLVKMIDGRGIPTDFGYSDRFGFPDDEAQSNAGAPDLAGGFSYAFPTKVTNELDHTAYTQYDYYLGKPVNSEDANGVVSSIAYNDVIDRPTQAIQARYKVGSGIPAERRQTTIIYDDVNRVITTTSDLNTFNDNALTTKSYFDGLGRTWRGAAYEGSTWSITDMRFDALSRVSQVSNPYRATEPGSTSPPSDLWTTTDYDALGRVIKVTTPDNAHVDTVYNGNQVTVTDQALKKRRSETDALGRLVKVTEDPDGLNYDTTYLYDVLGNLRKVTQGSQIRWFAYDSLSRLIRTRNPEQNCNPNLPPHTDPYTGGSCWATAYSYDANGNLTKKSDARGVEANYHYDSLNRNDQIDYINGPQTSTVLRSYDGAANGKGRLFYEYTLEGGVYVTHTAIDGYDALGRPVQKRQHFFHGGSWDPAYMVQQTYDLAGNVKTVRYPSGHTVNYSYDQAGRLSSFSGNLGGSPKTYADTIGYNAAGQIIKERFGTNTLLYHNSHYNNRLQLVDTRLGDSATDEWSWSRGAIGFYYGTTAVNTGDQFASDTDNNGNLRRQANYVPLASGGYVISQLDDYTYDALNRISSFTDWQVDGGGQWTQAASQDFSYDPYGNKHITSATGGVNNYNPTYDQATNRISGGNYYDAAGNVTTDPVTGVSMTYDAENRMLTATNGIYAYDADGKRVKRITGGQESWYIYGIGGELLAEYAANGAPGSPQKEYGYRAGQLLIVAESGSGGGVSFIKPDSKSKSDLIAKKGSGARRATDRMFSVDKPYTAFGHNKGYGSITAEPSDIDNSRTLARGGPRTTAEEHGNASSANGVSGSLLAEHPASATPRAPNKEYSARSGLSIVAAQSVSSVNPTAYQTPDPGQGGVAVTDATNRGHGSTTSSGSYGADQFKTCLWTGFQPVSGQILSINLKFDWTANGSVDAAANFDPFDSASASINLFIYYSINGGSNWIIPVHQQRSIAVGPGESNSDALDTSGSVTVSIPANTDITQIRVKDGIQANTDIIGPDPGTANASITVNISNIRLEVETDTTPPIISNVAAGGITATSATITWNTNESSDSQVEYGTSTDYGQSTTLNPELVTAHSQGLSGLAPGTTYHYRVKSRDASGNLVTSGNFSFTTTHVNNAAFVSQSVPATMTAGGTYAVTVTMLNQGTTTWTPGQLYRLGSQNPQDNGTWGLGRVNLSPGASVSPGATNVFSFVVTAPSSPGSYNFQWRMVRDGVEWFGATTPNVAVNVTAPDTTPPTVASFTPTNGATNVNVNANVTVTFSEAMDETTVNGSTIELRDPSNALVPAVVSYNAASHAATLDPTALLTAGVTYTARVRGGFTDPRVKDVAGNALASDLSWTFTTAQSGSVAIKWLVQDHLGSTRMVIDETGSLAGIERHDYAPFGEELVAGAIRTGNGYGGDSVRQKFTGYERDDETGLDFAQARYYSSTQGRFTSTDPIVMEKRRLGHPQEINLYAYTRNNPLKYVDPDGERFKGTDGSEVTIEQQKVNGKKIWVIKSNNASKDLQRLVDLINKSGSKTASDQFAKLNKIVTMINFVIDSTTSRSATEKLTGSTTIGLHQPHDKNGPLTFNSTTDKFNGKADPAVDQKGKVIPGAYGEATITLFEEKMIEIGITGQALDDELVSTFGHEVRHDTDPIQVQAGLTGGGANAIWHPERNGKPAKKSPDWYGDKIQSEIKASRRKAP